MAESDALKKYLDAGMAFTHLTRARAEQVVKDLVAAGELQRSQAKTAIDELLERSRKNAETLAEQVRREVDEQLASLGLARKADVEKLEEELARLKGDKGQDAAAAKADDASDKGSDTKEDTAAPPKKGAKKAAAAKRRSADKSAGKEPEHGDGGATGGAEAEDGVRQGEASSSTTETPAKAAKAAKKPAKSAAKPTQKAAKGRGDGGAPPSNRSTPAKKSAKKQG